MLSNYFTPDPVAKKWNDYVDKYGGYQGRENDHFGCLFQGALIIILILILIGYL